MKVFISSIISEYVDYRHAAAAAIRSLRYEVIRAEEFPAQPTSPRQACLAGVRASDVVVLLLGSRYGPVQDSRLSATHEEWHEAVDENSVVVGTEPVLVFVERRVERKPEQEAFINKVESWSQGRQRDSYESPSELQEKLVGALYDFSTMALDETAIARMESCAQGTLSLYQRGSHGRDELTAVVAAGPYRRLIRPGHLNGEDLSSYLQERAMFGEAAIFDRRSATRVGIVQGRLELRQDRAILSLDE